MIPSEKKYPEEKLIPLLEDFFRRIWKDTLLYSHDLSHHRRVWKYCSELSLLTGASDSEMEKILIAAYIHDLGMAVDPGTKHGQLSRGLCLDFLAENKMRESDYTDVLEAIETHDNKDYKSSGKSGKNNILKLLSAGDDLDAFGYTGIYRYLEIYLKRGMDPEIIGYEIRKNAAGRFRNFESGFAMYPEIIEKHAKRYYQLDKFMAGYNSCLNDKKYENSEGKWQALIVQLVSDMTDQGKSPSEIDKLKSNCLNNSKVIEFTQNLRSELMQV